MFFTQTARFLPPPLEVLDEPGEGDSSNAEDELVESGGWKIERRSEEKEEKEEKEAEMEEAEGMLEGKRSSTTE